MCGNKQKDKKANHIVSAWSKEDGYCLGQKAVKEKSNEITAIPELLEKIQIRGADCNNRCNGNPEKNSGKDMFKTRGLYIGIWMLHFERMQIKQLIK